MFMEMVFVNYFISFPCDSHYVAFIKIKRHTPLSLPCLNIREICLESFTISLRRNWAIKAQSSAKRRTPQPGTANGRSSMNERNMIGPSTVPCGTPDSSLDHSEASPSTITLWRRSDRKALIHRCVVPWIPWFHIFPIRRWWGTLSKDLEKSSTIKSICDFFSRCSWSSCVSERSCDSQLRRALKPCCLSDSTSWLLKWFITYRQ